MDINIPLWSTRFNKIISLKYFILLVLAGLHYHKKITDEKLKGQFKALRAGTLQKVKINYHCDITGIWYNGENPLEIFSDCIRFKDVKYIPFEEFIKYIHLFENRNYNHAINVFGSEYIYPLIAHWNPDYHPTNFSDFINFYIPGVSMINKSTYCFECGHKHDEYVNDVKENCKVISEWLHYKKKGNLKKIPIYDIKSRTISFWS